MTAFLAGAGLGLVGNVLQASAQQESERNAWNNQSQMRRNQLPLLLALAGGSNASALGRSLLSNEDSTALFGSDPALTPALQDRLRYLQGQLADMGQSTSYTSTPRGRGGWLGGNPDGGSTGREQRAASDAAAQKIRDEIAQISGQLASPTPGAFNAAEVDKAASMLPGAQYAKIAEQDKQAGLGQLGRYDTETENMIRMLSGFGDAEKARIEKNSARDLTGANRLASLRLSRAGAGSSSLLSGALAQNAGQIGERRNNAITDINSGVLQQRLGIMGQRSGGRLGLETGLNQNNLNLQTAPLNQQMAILANIGQSGLGSNSFQPIGGVSPLGTGLQSAGNSLSYWGGLNSLGQQSQSSPNIPVDWSYGAGSTLSGSNRPR